MRVLKNLSKGVRKKYKINFADSYFEQSLGLMGRKLEPKEIMILRFSKQGLYGIHTWFMRQTIDAIFLDKNKRVKKIKKAVKPWKSIEPTKCKYIMEANPNFSELFSIEKENKIKWKERV